MKAYWHIHHDILVELSDNIEERIEFIKRSKSPEEIPLRLKLLKAVKGKLPKEIIEACVTYDRAGIAYNKARDAYNEIWMICKEARVAYDKAEIAYDKARVAYYEVLNNHRAEIEALHAAECPNCPWDGKTIFSRQ